MLKDILDPTIDVLKGIEKIVEDVVKTEREKFRLHIHRHVLKKDKKGNSYDNC